MASDGADVTCDGAWKTVPEVGARSWKSPFADGGEVERRYRTASWLELVCTTPSTTLAH